PAPWYDPDSPPWRDGEPGSAGLGHHNVPAGFVADSIPSLTATFGHTAVSATRGVPVAADGQNPQLPVIRVVSDDLAASGGADLWEPGGHVRVHLTDPVPGKLGRTERRLRWRFVHGAPDGSWVP